MRQNLLQSLPTPDASRYLSRMTIAVKLKRDAVGLSATLLFTLYEFSLFSDYFRLDGDTPRARIKRDAASFAIRVRLVTSVLCSMVTWGLHASSHERK